MTEGNGHIIDPAGDARRALIAAVAEHGPEALSNAVIMDSICQERLSDLPGEAILIGSAARTDVPALLHERIPGMGNYGAIQSVATTLAEAHGLDTAACLWVVREFARALGLIASGGTQPRVGISPGDTGGALAPAEAAVGAEAAGTGAGSGAAAASESAGAGTAANRSPSAEAAASAGPADADAAHPGVAGPGAGEMGFPAGTAGDAGRSPPGRPLSKSRGPSRNIIGVVAAIALVAVYLGVAAVAHLSPFPAKTVAVTSSAPPTRGNSSSPQSSPHATARSSPPSQYQILLSKIPGDIQGTNNCHNIGTGFGATAVSRCVGLNGPATEIYYYLFPGTATLSTGYNSLLNTAKFKKGSECTTNGKFVSFIAQCESGFTNPSPNITGNIAEYTNKSHNPVIVTSDSQQHLMVALVGTNDSALLAYWNQLHWVLT